MRDLELLVRHALVPGGYGPEQPLSFPVRDGALSSDKTAHAVRLGQEDGERQLCALASSEELESLWLYLPEALWLYPPVQRIVFVDEERGTATQGFLNLIADIGQDYVHYHIQPEVMRTLYMGSVEDSWRLQEWYGDASSETLAGLRKAAYRYLGAELALPSARDLVSFRHFADANPLVHGEFRIASPAGITSIALDGTEDIAAKYTEAHARLSASFQDNLEAYLALDEREVIRQSCAALSEAVKGLSLDFRPAG